MNFNVKPSIKYQFFMNCNKRIEYHKKEALFTVILLTTEINPSYTNGFFLLV